MTKRTQTKANEGQHRLSPALTPPWEEVRAEKIARARKLVESGSNYPSKEVLKSVAELLAKHLRPD